MNSTISAATASTIRVVAPATLAEDYTFDVTLGGNKNSHPTAARRPYTVTVPKGGVKKGEIFEIPFPGGCSNFYSNDGPADEEEEDEDRTSDDRNEENGGSDLEEQLTQPCRSNSRESNDDEYDNNMDDDGNTKYPNDEDDFSNSNGEIMEDDDAPRGEWRHSLFACCDVVTQATFWTAVIFPPVLLAQLVTRLGLSYRGLGLANNNTKLKQNQQHLSSHTVFAEATEEATLSYNKILLSFVVILGLGNILPGVGVAVVAIYVLLLLAYVGSNLRQSLRRRYRIPVTMPWLWQGCRRCRTPTGNTKAKATTNKKSAATSRRRSVLSTKAHPNNNARTAAAAMEEACGERLEDCACMIFCGCCSLIQMARHTHNDKEYPGFCCTTTGLEGEAPKIV